MKFLFVVCCSLLASFALAEEAGNQEVDVAGVTATFMGNSGGMKLETSSGRYLMVQQDKLEEFNPDSTSCPGCFSMNVAGQNSWTPFEEQTDAATSDTTVYTTTFTVEENGVSFELTAHVAVVTSTVEEDVPCSACNSTDPLPCQNEAGECADYTAEGVCPGCITSVPPPLKCNQKVSSLVSC
jgi:hypothetical protein